MKILLVLFALAVLVHSEHHEDDLKCNFRICGAELLNFEHFGISSIFRKVEIGSFCIRNCTPPVVHEFFQSIIFGITRRIPNHCSGEGCAEKNRFVALAKCAKEKAWPLLQCSKRLIDLAHIGLLDYSDVEKTNSTCSIVVDTTQCIEEILQTCGEQPFSLVKEIFGDVVKLGVNAYCHPAFRDKSFIEPPSTIVPYEERMKHFTDITPMPGKHPYPQFVKGYRKGNAAVMSQNILSIIASVAISIFLFHQY
ncbi:uncharacterized protein [Parasteatoda tepidariorum]|uniref:uncharacterized protein n=1 Tax=Parasteatoda tepidariorum TaxID=114398 RepID=UPI00077FB85A|nr:uncharacterized protein LOC107456136 [Parasteatoda tepidariorum]